MLTVKLDRLVTQPGQFWLDLGCGEGRHVHGLRGLPGVNVIGLDLDEVGLRKARAGLDLVPDGGGAVLLAKGDAFRLPFADHSIDGVICSEVLEHLPDYGAALLEIRRILKPGGQFAATVPHAWPERLCWDLAPGPGGYADQPGGHVRIFEERPLRQAIEGVGFGYRGRHFAHALHSPYWWLKTALWNRRDDHPLVQLYHRFLVWDMMQRPVLTRGLEALLNPLMGKSLALYFVKRAG